jgi:uncharacterized protein (DUF433 family)
MSQKSATLGVRMSAKTCEQIKQISASQGRTPSDLLAEYAEEIVRSHQFCHIEFRSTPLGRMAYVEGTRTAVWLVVDLVRQNRGNVKKTAQIHEWSIPRISAALNYAKAFPEEIEPLIKKAHSMSEADLRQLNAA